MPSCGCWRRKTRTLGTVEWGTDGLLANWLAEAVTAAARMSAGSWRLRLRRGSAVVNTGAVEEPIETLIGELAKGCKRLLKTDYALATGPLPHYDPAGSDSAGFLVRPRDTDRRFRPIVALCRQSRTF